MNEENKVINREDFIREVASRNKDTLKNTRAFFEAYEAAMQDYLVKGNKIKLYGFATYETRVKKSKTIGDPRTKKPVEIPSKRCVKFTPSKELTELIKIT